jgi:hypothetical protein
MKILQAAFHKQLRKAARSGDFRSCRGIRIGRRAVISDRGTVISRKLSIGIHIVGRGGMRAGTNRDFVSLGS